MDDHQVVNADAAYLVSGALLDDEPVGPLYATGDKAHLIARTAIAGVGGTVRILRGSPGGWLEVARYTDAGPGSSLQQLIDSGRAVFLDRQ